MAPPRRPNRHGPAIAALLSCSEASCSLPYPGASPNRVRFDLATINDCDYFGAPRLYKDKEQDQWASTSSFGRDDLLLVAKVADTAHTWIFEQAHEKQDDPQS